MKKYDAIIIGAGAAGLMCSAISGQRGLKVLLIEKSAKIGEKIRISGGSRCNFTNIYTNPKNFISQNQHFCVSALSQFSAEDFINLVKKHNIKFHEKTLGQLFCDFSSQEIIDMFLKECEVGKVEISKETLVKKIDKNENGDFELEIKKGEENEKISCKSLVIATGGLSIPKIGASGFGYDVARQFGLKIVETRPALAPLVIEEELLKDLKELAGVSFFSEVSVNFEKKSNDSKAQKNKAPSFREAVLITHRGLSGPAILQISSYLENGQEILINMAPDQDIYQLLLDEKKQNPKQEVSAILAKFLPKRLALFIAKKHGVKLNIADLKNEKLKEISKNVNSWIVKIKDNEGYSKAEVTLGGVDTDEISSKTFESKNVKGLYFIGEVLDVTGHLGGFNFQFAWSSGFVCGKSLDTVGF